MKQFLLMCLVMVYCSGGSNIQAQVNWEAANGPHGGTVRDMAIAPSGEMYIVTTVYLPIYPFSSGKIYKSTNEGNLWSEVSYTGSPIGITINQAGELIAADTDTRIYKSSNGGATWQQAGDLDYPIAAIEGKNSRQAAGTSLISHDHGNTVARGSLYLSTNNGASWSAKLTQLSVTRIHITAAGVIFAGVSTSTPVTYQVRRSTNDGASWDILNLPAGSSGYSNITSSGSGSGKIFITSSNGVYSSTDNGTTWLASFTGGGCNFVQSDGAGSIYALNFLITTGGVKYTLVKSTNDGASWSAVAPLPSFSVKDLAFPAAGKIFSATSMGVFLSTTGGASWDIKNNGINTNSAGVVASNNGRLFAATGSGVFYSDNNGGAWSLVNTIGLVTGIENIVISAGSVYMKSYQNIYRSTNNGDSWSTVWHDTLADISTDLIATTAGALMFGVYDFGMDIYRSTNGGTTWELAKDSLALSVGSISAGFGGKVYAGVSAAGGTKLLSSSDNGSTWNTVFTDPTFQLQFREVIENESGLFVNTYSDLKRSTDNGLSWHSASTGITGSLASGTLIRNAEGKLFINSNGGVFSSTDGGLNWTANNTGIQNLVVSSICLNAVQRLFAGTSMGVYRSSTPTGITGAVTVTGYKLHQNYPNPFNPATSISYELPSAGFVKFAVYDVTGRLVQTVVNNVQEAGAHQVTFNGSGLTSGIYFYKLETENFSEVKKMMLVK